MKNRIKEILLEKYLHYRLRMIKPDRNMFDFARHIRNINNILVIMPTDPAKDDEMHEFAAELYSIFDGVRVSTFERKSFRASDGNWFGLPKEGYLQNFRDEKFDLVIDLNPIQDRLCALLSALCGAPLRLNRTSGPYDHVYNLYIRSNPAKTNAGQLKNILNYLKTFRQSA